ncbi:hypothetical protein ACWCRF_27825 [Streptomyces sp. NPDC002405]|uniref:hypothetical protein n=1 Tax=unclassified Streptomyces TaxID=2593676 RepID=UPI00369A52DF
MTGTTEAVGHPPRSRPATTDSYIRRVRCAPDTGMVADSEMVCGCAADAAR